MSVSIADLDGDNFPELILGGGGGITESLILWNDGTGNYDYAELTTIPGVPGWQEVWDILSVDIESDGDLDLLMAYAVAFPVAQRYIQVLVNNGDRTFTDETQARLFGLTRDAQWVNRMKPIDFNGDGSPDFVLQHDDFPFQGYPELIFVNNGSGVFTALDNSAIANKTGLLFPVDADGDGGLDFIVWNGVFPRVDFDFSLLLHN